ncbi:MAG: NrfD/PsrC family molybdoenzyme membrane anchor subunit [Vicinamibacterales bacterium]
MSEDAQPPGYYGFPLLKGNVWTWEIPTYFFVGGAAGAAALIGAVAKRTGGSDALVRDARWIAAAGAALSPPLLISDLGRPERFLNMLRVFKVRSPMSVGAWTLVAFSTFAGAAAFADLARRATGGRLPVQLVGDVSELLSAATGMVLTTYTGVLLGATAIPVWSTNARVLPVHFGASGLGTAVAMLELLGHRTRALNAIGIGTALVETALAAHLEASANPALAPIKSGEAAALARTAAILSGPLPLALRVLAGHSASARRLAAAATVAGSILTRIAWVRAGKI